MAVRFGRGGLQSYDPGKSSSRILPKKSSTSSVGRRGTSSKGTSQDDKKRLEAEKVIQQEAAKLELKQRAAEAETQRIQQEQIQSQRIQPTTNIISGKLFSQGTPDYSKGYYKAQYQKSLRPSGQAIIEPSSPIRLPYGEKDVIRRVPQFGTITQDAPRGFKEVSLIGELKEAEIIDKTTTLPKSVILKKLSEEVSNKVTSKLTPKYQKMIDEGQDIKDVEKAFETEAKLEFEKQVKQAEASPELQRKLILSKSYRGSFKKAFDPVYKKEQQLKKLELGADIIAGVSPLAVPYFVGKGIYKVSKGSKKDIQIVEKTPSGRVFKPTYSGFIPSEETKEGLAYLGIGAASAISLPGKIGKQVTSLRQSELVAKPWTTSAKRLTSSGDTTLFKITRTKATPYAVADATLLSPVKQTGKESFKVLASKGNVNVRVVDFMKTLRNKGTPILKRSSTRFTAFGRGGVKESLFDQGAISFSSEETKLFKTTGEGYFSTDAIQSSKDIKVLTGKDFFRVLAKRPVKPKIVTKIKTAPIKTSTFEFGGLSYKEGDGVIKFTSGKLSKARLYPQTGKATGLFKPGEYGEILLNPKAETIPNLFKSIKEPVTRSSRQFIDDLYKPTKEIIKKSIPKKSVPIIDDITNYGKKTITKQITKGVQGSDYAYGKSQFFASQYGSNVISQVEPLAVKGLSITSQSITPSAISVLGVASKSIFDTAVKPKLKSKTLTRTRSITKQINSLSLKTRAITKQSQKLSTRQVTKQSQVSAIPNLAFSKSVSTNRSLPLGIVPKGFILPLSNSFIPVAKKKKQGYIPQAKTKGGKWLNLSKKPLTRSKALSRGARAVDNTLSAQFRIKKSKAKAVKGKGFYFGNTQEKYRPYKIKKGKKIELHNHFIETRKNRIDSPGEKKGLKLARYIKSKGWTKKKVKKNK